MASSPRASSPSLFFCRYLVAGARHIWIDLFNWCFLTVFGISDVWRIHGGWLRHIGEFTGICLRSVTPLARSLAVALIFIALRLFSCCISGLPLPLLLLLLGFALPIVLVSRRLYCWGNWFCLTARPDLHSL